MVMKKFFVITAEYPANNKIKMLGDILMDGGYKNCMPVIPEWQSYYNIKGEVFFDRQMVGVSESDNKIVFVVFSYKGLSLDSPGNTEMFVSVQRFVFSSKEGLEDALKYLDVQRFPKCEICFTYFEGLSGPCPTSASMNCPASSVAVGSGISLVCFPMEAMGLKDTGICTAECPL